MPLRLLSRQAQTIPLEVEGVLPEVVRDKSLGEIEQIQVLFGNRKAPLGDFFRVSGSASDDSEIVWEGECSHVKRIGEGMTTGKIIVAGSVGMHLGAEMRGGEILLEGDASDWVGAEMTGGMIQIRGNAQDHLGAAYRGAKRGMNGGEILVSGSVGHEAGHEMRRGLIAVGGTLGDSAGFQMSGGTIMAFSRLGIRAGAGMNRGTIVWLGEGTAPVILPTYRRSVSISPVFLRVYLEHLKRQGFPVPQGCTLADYRRYCGDFVGLGKGEILLREAA